MTYSELKQVISNRGSRKPWGKTPPFWAVSSSGLPTGSTVSPRKTSGPTAVRRSPLKFRIADGEDHLRENAFEEPRQAVQEIQNSDQARRSPGRKVHDMPSRIRTPLLGSPPRSTCASPWRLTRTCPPPVRHAANAANPWNASRASRVPRGELLPHDRDSKQSDKEQVLSYRYQTLETFLGFLVTTANLFLQDNSVGHRRELRAAIREGMALLESSDQDSKKAPGLPQEGEARRPRDGRNTILTLRARLRRS